MDFADEPYVRKYTRKTATDRMLGWEGRAVRDAMLGEFDRAGVFDFRCDLVRSISAVTDIPDEVVRVALDRLIETETWIINARQVVWPTFEEAQNCSRSDRLRQRASRKARATNAVTDVTASHSQSQPVTAGHSQSQPVTASHPPIAPSAPIAPIASLAERAPDRACAPVASFAPEPTTQPPPPSSIREAEPEPEPTLRAALPDHATDPPAAPATLRRITGRGVASQPPKLASVRAAPAPAPTPLIARTYTMPGPDPPQAYLDEALMRGVSPEQARSTWKHYHGAGLPERGVERLYEWLSQRAQERMIATTRFGPRCADGDDRMRKQAERIEWLRAKEAAEEAAAREDNHQTHREAAQ